MHRNILPQPKHTKLIIDVHGDLHYTVVPPETAIWRDTNKEYVRHLHQPIEHQPHECANFDRLGPDALACGAEEAVSF